MNLAFQRRTDLAFSVMRRLADSPSTVPGRRLADETGTTTSFLPQVVAPLVRAGWVDSDRGPGGGYRLTASAADVTVLDVIEAVQGPADDGRCALRDAPCPGDRACPVHEAWSTARRFITTELSRVRVLEIEGAPS